MSVSIQNQSLKLYYSQPTRRYNVKRSRQGVIEKTQEKSIKRAFNQGGFLKKLKRIDKIPGGLINYFEFATIKGGEKYLTLIDFSNATKVDNIINNYLNIVGDMIEDDFPEMLKSYSSLSKDFIADVNNRFKVLQHSLDRYRRFVGDLDDKLRDITFARKLKRFQMTSLNSKLRSILKKSEHMIKIYQGVFSKKGGDYPSVSSDEVSWKIR